MVLKKIASNKYLDVIVGLLMFAFALTQFQEFFEYGRETGDGLGTHHAVAFLGLVLFFKGVLMLMTGTALIGDSIDREKAKGFLHLLREIAENWLFNLIIAVLLIVVGTAEFVEEIKETREGLSVWHLGAVFTGLIFFFKSQSILLDSVSFMRKLENRNGVMKRYVPKISRFFKHPKLEIALAVAIVLVGVIEMFTVQEGDGHGHKSIIVFGLSRIIKIVEPTGAFVDLVEDADRIV